MHIDMGWSKYQNTAVQQQHAHHRAAFEKRPDGGICDLCCKNTVTAPLVKVKSLNFNPQKQA